MPTVRMSAAEYLKRLRKLPARIKRETVSAMRVSGREARKTAIRLSSGTASYAQLRRAGHPYSLRAPQPDLYPPAIINTHRADGFRSHWRSDAPRVMGDTIIARVFNDSSVAKYMDGTSRMVERPIADAVLSIILPDHEKRIRQVPITAWNEVMNQ